MKKITFLFLNLTFLSLSIFGQTEIQTIKKTNKFITEKKYETAFNLLDKFDAKNDKPEIVLLKEKILLNYFVTSIMHQLFALKDINKDEDILDYRGKNGSYNMHIFPVDSILTRLIKIYPDNCKLHKGLADYYYEVHLKYGGNWLKDDNELFRLIETNYQKAIDGNCADYLSYYVLGYINLTQKKYKKSIPYLLKSIKMNNGYASSHYNLAYAYLFNGERKKALKYAINSFDLYNDKVYKSDAARMIGQIYTELNDDKNALKYYEIADKLDPNNYYNITAILNLYLKADNQKANEMTKAFFDLAPTNPTIYDDLEDIYFNNKKTSELINFYKSQFNVFQNNPKVLGNLNFYLARIYLKTDKKIAKDYLIKAKKEFIKVFDKNHPVFKAIDEGLENCKK